jgi:type I restriction enzyme S subunit
MKTNLLQKNIPKGWELRDFLDCVLILTKIVGLKSSEYKRTGKFPIFDQAKDYISGYTDRNEVVQEKIPAILFGDHTRVLKIINKPFALGADGIKIFYANKDIDPNFLYQQLLKLDIPNTGYNRHFKWLKDSKLVIPTILEQKKIAGILSSIDLKISKIENSIIIDEKLKIGLMQDFFSKSSWGYKRIDEVATVLTGGTPKTSTKEFWNGDINWMSSGEVNLRRIKNTEKKITQKGLDGSNATLLPIGTVMIALAGQGKTRGKVAILEIETTCNQSLAGIVTDKDFLYNEFLFYNLEYRYKELRNVSGGEGRTGLNLKLIKNFKVPVPPIEMQKRIVNTLVSIDERVKRNNLLKDKFLELKNGLVSDLLSGKIRTVNN